MNRNDPFAKARPNQKVTTNEMPKISEKTDENPEKQNTFDPFSKARPENVSQPSWLDELGRHALRLSSRAAETVLGMPGDILNTAESLILGGAENITGADLSGIRKDLRKTAPFKVLPTSSELRQLQSQITGGATEPKEGTWEEDVDNVTKFATALKTGGADTLRSLGTALGAIGAGRSAQALGFGEPVKAASEIGTMFLLHNISPGKAQQFVDNSYEKAKDAIPPKTMIPTDRYVRNLDELEQTFLRGAPTPSKKSVLDILQPLRNRASGGAIEADELVQAYKDINETLNSKDLFNVLGSKGKPIARIKFEKLKDQIRKELDSYGQYNPEFIKNWTSANAGHAAIEKSKSTRDWISSKIRHIPEKLFGTAAFEALSGYPELAAGTVGTAAGAFTGLRAFETIHRFMKSDLLRKHYLDAIKHASASNLPAMVKSLERLDEADRKESKKKMTNSLNKTPQNR